MAKTKTNTEIALSDIKKGQKLVRDAVKRLKGYIESRDKKIDYLVKKLDSKEAYYEEIFQQAFGVNSKNYLEGYGFEKHVVWWMNTYHPQYKLKIWQGDKMAHPYEDGEIIYPSWNQYPDLIYSDEKQNKVLALECKYRQNGKFELTKEQYAHYTDFETLMRNLQYKDVDVYVMIGDYGITSDKPLDMYCIPLHYFENHPNINAEDLPQYKVMERTRGITNFPENCPF